MSKVKCGVIRDLLPLVTDDVASAETKELVEEHLQECGFCRGYLEGMTAQLAKLSEEPPEDTSFIRFCRRMEKRFRLRRLLIGLLIAALTVIALGGAAALIHHKTIVEWTNMPIEWTEATVFREISGEVGVAVRAADGHKWYGMVSTQRMDDVMYITPRMPAWRLFARGYDSSFVYGPQLFWEEGGVVEIYNEYDVVYDETLGNYVDRWTPVRWPIRYIRWGTPDNFVTIYEEGDEILYSAEVQQMLGELGLLADNMTIYGASAPMPTPEPETAAALSGREADPTETTAETAAAQSDPTEATAESPSPQSDSTEVSAESPSPQSDSTEVPAEMASPQTDSTEMPAETVSP